MHQNRIASLRAVATIALPCPRRTRARRQKALNGPGWWTTNQVASTGAHRAETDQHLEIEPDRAGVSPDWRTPGVQNHEQPLGLGPAEQLLGDELLDRFDLLIQERDMPQRRPKWSRRLDGPLALAYAFVSDD